MSTIVEFAIEPGEYLLGGVVEDIPDLSIELERVVPLGRRIMPYLWCQSEALDAFEAVLDDHPTVENYVVLDRIEDDALYRIEWSLVSDSLVDGIWQTDATLLEASAADTWRVRLLFENRRDLKAFHRHLLENDATYTLERIYSVRRDDADPGTVLTAEQRAALVAATTQGYFRVPRETTMAAIGRELGISEQATSERIRRGVDAVLRDVLADGDVLADELSERG